MSSNHTSKSFVQMTVLDLTRPLSTASVPDCRLLASIAILLLFRGGYYELPTLVVSLLLSGIALFVHLKRISNKAYLAALFPIGLLLLSLISAGLCGYGSYSLVKVAPYAAISAASLCAAQIENGSKEQFINLLSLVGLASSALAIIFYFVFPTAFGFVSSGRLQAFFQYANTAAVWFAVAAILLLLGGGKKALSAIVPTIALLLTKSVSVICLFCLALLYLLATSSLSKRKKALSLLAALLVGFVAVVFIGPSRMTEACQTFVERIIQWYDGLRLLLRAPLLGIGPGTWRHEYQRIQSAQYTARVIHNGFLQVGLETGLIGFLLFVIWAIRGLGGLAKCASSDRNARAMFAVALLLAIHMFVDVDFAFGAVDLLLGTFLTFGCSRRSQENQPESTSRLGQFSAGFCAIACTGVCLVSCMRILPRSNAPVGLFAADPELRYGYANELCENQEFAAAIDFIEGTDDSNTTDLLVLEAGAQYCLGNQGRGEELLLDLLSEEPMNTKLFDLAYRYFQRYGVSEAGASRFRDLELQANMRLSQYPAVLLTNQEFMRYEIG